MVKKRAKAKKKTTPKKKTVKKPSAPKLEVNASEKILIENLVSLQKVMTNLAIKFNSLTHQISNLLELFEISAKALASKDFTLEKESKDTKEILSKIDNLNEQNKIIARGLTLLHEKEGNLEAPLPPPQAPRPQPAPPQRPPIDKSSVDIGEYEKSISTRLRPSSNQENTPSPDFRATQNKRIMR